MDMIKIDALGEQCPIPVVKTVKVIDGLEKAALLEVHFFSFLVERSHADLSCR